VNGEDEEDKAEGGDGEEGADSGDEGAEGESKKKVRDCLCVCASSTHGCETPLLQPCSALMYVFLHGIDVIIPFSCVCICKNALTCTRI